MSRIRGAVPSAVFVDGTGRRRRVVAVIGAGFAVALLVALGLLVSGVSGNSPLHLPGLPEDAGARAPAGAHSSSGDAPEPNTSRARLVPSLIPTPAAVASVPSRAPAGQASVTPRGRRPPSQTPVHPGQSKWK
jgi:hypothetical protein